MKKMIIYTFIAIILLVVLVFAFLAFIGKKYTTQPVVSGMGHASLSFGSESIEFNYPTFKGWDVVLDNDSSITYAARKNIFVFFADTAVYHD